MVVVVFGVIVLRVCSNLAMSLLRPACFLDVVCRTLQIANQIIAVMLCTS